MSDPVRFNWNLFPSTKLEANEMLTPLGCMYTPLGAEALVTSGEVIKCSLCSNIINPFIKVDRENRMWWCPFCSKMSFFPETFELHEKGASDGAVPAEIRPSSHNTVDYVLPIDISAKDQQFVVAYVIDTYQHTDTIEQREFDTLKNAIADNMALLPKDTLVLLVTFNDTVEVHIQEKKNVVAFLPELLFLDNYDFSKLFTDQKLIQQVFSKLDIDRTLAPSSDMSSLLKSGIIAPNLKSLQDYVKTLRPKLTHSFKPARATGLAVFLTTLLLSNSFTGLIGKVNLFCSGPATSNPGRIVEESATMRSHHDVANFNAPHFISAAKFYQTMSFVSCGYLLNDAYTAVYTSSGKVVNYAVSDSSPKFSFDIYTGSLDQVGVYEMKSLASGSSGSIVLTDGFQSTRFKENLNVNTSSILEEKHNCKFTVTTSTGIKVMKAICAGTELQSSYQSEKLSALHHAKISDMVTRFDLSMKKRNFTNQWYLGNLNDLDTVAVYFEMETVNSSSMLDEISGAKEVYIQFQTKFYDLESANTILRVTTVKRPTTLSVLAANKVRLSNNTYKLVNTRSSIVKEKALLESFDYKAWMVLFTRLLINKIDTTIGYESFEEVVNDVDSALIRLTRFFGGLQIDTRSSSNPYDNLKLIYSINESFKELPALSYSLRRNPQLIRIFNSSPDETAYYHHMFNKCETDTSCVMIHPNFYKLESTGLLEKLSLDVTSLDTQAGDDSFFVLDSIFNVIIYYRYSDSKHKIALHNSNNDELIYGKVKDPKLTSVLETVKTQLIDGRNIIPNIVLTQSGHSQARFLLARLYPVLDKPEEEASQQTSWWSFFAKLNSNHALMTDDVSVNKYYDELLDKVQNYKIGTNY
ncbi:CIC11C00000004654 [Sungouiella intermedia]|uniref:Protein transport protein SEC23 n=1 Tax=Sungouiella intermedia TaxID=45354 RepID=A0A1L0DI09_9ASCO|nr:CIC11C00000004654 [[Candida] intermedia]